MLNATIKHHIGQYEQCDPSFTQKFLESIYVDDLTSGDSNVDRTFELYVKSKLHLKEAGFNLQKFVTNSEELRERIEKNERSASRSEEVEGDSETLIWRIPQVPHLARYQTSSYHPHCLELSQEGHAWRC